jgi:hypothetical protein
MVCLAIALLGLNMTLGREQASKAAEDAAAPTGGSTGGASPPSDQHPPELVAPAFPAEAAYSGKTNGRRAGEANVAILIQNQQAVAYVYDGKQLASWLAGPVTGSAMRLRGPGSSELTAELNRDKKVTGRVAINGGSWPFTVVPSQGVTQGSASGGASQQGSGSNQSGHSTLRRER